MDRFTALRTFCSVVELRSFTRAADEMLLSRSAISKNINELERHLGVTLIRRSTREISVTEAGGNYYEQVRQILTDLQSADDSARQAGRTPSGNLRISVPVSLGLLHITSLIPLFMDLYPDITVETILTDRTVDLLKEGFDLAIRTSSRLEDSCSRSRQIGNFEHVICASPQYLGIFPAPTTPFDLKHHNILVYTVSAAPERWKFISGPNLKDDSCVIQVLGRYRSNNSLSLKQAALAGKGIVRIPDLYIKNELEEGRLVPLLAEWKMEKTGIWVIYPNSHFLPQRLRVFIDFLTSQLPNLSACSFV